MSGAWRGIRISDNTLYPPAEGWDQYKYVVVSKPQLVSEDKKERRDEKESVDYREREPLDFGEDDVNQSGVTTVLVSCYYCVDTVLILRYCCVDTVLILLYCCVGIVLVYCLYWS